MASRSRSTGGVAGGPGIGRLAVAAILVGLLCWFAGRPAESRLAWASDLDSATTAAQAQGLPLLVDFWASWCPQCQVLDELVFSVAEVESAVTGAFLPVRVDLSSNSPDTSQAGIAGRYGILGIPAVLIVDSNDGSVIRRAAPSDLASASAFVEFLSRQTSRG
jgi:thiol:disulfide interchange protein